MSQVDKLGDDLITETLRMKVEPQLHHPGSRIQLPDKAYPLQLLGMKVSTYPDPF